MESRKREQPSVDRSSNDQPVSGQTNDETNGSVWGGGVTDRELNTREHGHGRPAFTGDVEPVPNTGGHGEAPPSEDEPRAKKRDDSSFDQSYQPDQSYGPNGDADPNRGERVGRGDGRDQWNAGDGGWRDGKTDARSSAGGTGVSNWNMDAPVTSKDGDK